MNTRHLLIAAGLTTIGTLAGFAVKALADGIPSPNPLYYSGTLTEGGMLVSGTRAITVTLWLDATTSGSPLCTTVASTATIASGRFRIALASSCKAIINQNNNVYVEVIDGATSLGRSPVGAVPYAVEADHAVSATNATRATNADNSITAVTAANAEDGGTIASAMASLSVGVSGLSGRLGTSAEVLAEVNTAISGGGTLDIGPVSFPSVANNFMWALNHAAANGACAALTPVTPGNNVGVVVAKLYMDTCTTVCAAQSGTTTCRGDIAASFSGLVQATGEQVIARNYNYGCSNNSGASQSEIGATDPTLLSRYCCCSN